VTYDHESHEPGKTHPWWPLDLPILIKQLSVAVCAIASRCGSARQPSMSTTMRRFHGLTKGVGL
jgi:hypothetical protein